MRAPRVLFFFSLPAFVGLAACRETPNLTIVDDDGAAPPTVDATAPEASAPDAGEPTDTGTDDDAGPVDDGGTIDDASALCGAANVATCASCPGRPILCGRTATPTCVADCADCGAGWLPCVHCAGGLVLAKCAALNAKGVLPCAAAGKCACDDGGASACPVVPGAAQVCVASPTKMKCATCGEARSDGAPCGAGATGTCDAQSNPPVCR